MTNVISDLAKRFNTSGSEFDVEVEVDSEESA